jgi:hypothetical protein
MRYQFRCPLCLKKLGPAHTLVAFRIVEAIDDEPPLSLEVDCGNEDFIGEILRFGGEAIYTPTTENAVFISHVQCNAINPFWTEVTKQDGDDAQTERRSAKIKIPGKAADGVKIEGVFIDRKTSNQLRKTMQHKIIKMLRDTLKYSEEHRAMWFPFALLRSTATIEGEYLRRPFGSLVEMASAPGVGKTILTLQLMNARGYAHNDRVVRSVDYFFPRREMGGNARYQDAFMKELFFHSTWNVRPEFRPPPTPELTPGDLRAILIEPVSEASPAKILSHRPAGGKNASRLQKMREGLRYFLEELGLKEKNPIPKTDLVKELRQTEYWHPVLFYDTAGESHVSVSEVTRAVRRLTNKLAICIDAEELFDKDGENKSINLACARILTMIEERERKSCCLIITKLDLISLDEEKKRTLVKIAEDLRDTDVEARQLLVKWLKEFHDADKDNLRQYLLSSDGRIEKVFFVWTENLPKMTDIRSYPIEGFEPKKGDVGTEVTIKATTGYDFNGARKLYFNEQEADFKVESSEVIKAKVPAGATTGFIEIEIEEDIKDGPDKGKRIDVGTSEQYFIVTPSTRRRNEPNERPQSYGLIKFLSWCLDKSPQELIRDFGADPSDTNGSGPGAGE